jgi:hypothetical protein
VKWQEWVKSKKLKVLIIFEGRDAAGKGGCIKRVVEPLNQRGLRVVALPAPTPAETTSWYFQRYINHFPSGGEIVIFDRSYYNRAGVEKVMGFATPAQVDQFFEQVPALEKMWTDAGIILIKLWFSVSGEHWRRRGRDRASHSARFSIFLLFSQRATHPALSTLPCTPPPAPWSPGPHHFNLSSSTQTQSKPAASMTGSRRPRRTLSCRRLT